MSWQKKTAYILTITFTAELISLANLIPAKSQAFPYKVGFLLILELPKKACHGYIVAM